MNYTNPELLARIEAFAIDAPGVALSFTARLARENGWSAAYAARVVTEYKRFVYLAMQAGHPVTPSEDVDQAWHLHMVYTRSYWTKFCGEILPRPLHHDPTAGGASEGAKFHDWYARTLESYEREFGSAPPDDVWPSVAQRFATAGQQRWVDPGQYWIVPKLRLLNGIRAFVGKLHRPGLTALTLLMVLSVATGCASLQSRGVNVFDWDGPAFLWFYVLCLGLASVVAYRRKRLSLAASEPASDEALALDPYSLAYLKGGPALVAQAAVMKLVGLGCLEVKKGFVNVTVQKLPLPEDITLEPIESRLLGALSHESKTMTRLEIMPALKSSFEEIRAQLERRGLLQSAGERTSQGCAIMLPMLLCMGLGIIKVIVGLSRDKPVFFLVALIVITLILGMIIANRPHRTRKGSAILGQHRSAWQAEQSSPSYVANMSLIPLALACGGNDALAPWGLDQTANHVGKNIAPQSNSSSGCGSSSSGCGSSGCGGSGCGGGCGGCGGGGD